MSDPTPTPIERLTKPVLDFMENKVAGAALLLFATFVAMIWANSPYAASYDALLSKKLVVGLPELFKIEKPLLLWINDGLMAVFFFVVGLEIKRELIAGELSSVRKATLPVAAALGGMVGPALIYAGLNWGQPGIRGWGIPMATDIAFALGVLSLLGSRVPLGLKVFLTAVAIVDDIGAILVIAIFYTESIATTSLIVAGVFLGVAFLVNRGGVRNPLVYLVIGIIVWAAFLKSGVHATLAAVLMAFTIPARTRIDGHGLVERMSDKLSALQKTGLHSGKDLLTHSQEYVIARMGRLIEHSTSPLQRLEHALVPLVTFVIMPLFALANAGVTLSSEIGAALTSPISYGIVSGLFFGKIIGITGFSLLAVKSGLADLPRGVTWGQVVAAAALAGIGFTMSLFIEALAFEDPAQREAAKVGILLGSSLSGTFGLILLTRTLPRVGGAPER